MQKSMKHIFSFLFAVVVSSAMYAQQDPQYSMYMFNGLAINPAYAGSLGHLSANGLYRTQWMGIDGAPTTLTANVHGTLKNDAMGLGLQMVNDRIGVMSRTMISGIGAYQLKMPTFRISFGLQANYNQYVIGLNEVQSTSDGSVDVAFGSPVNTNTFNFGTGVFAFAEKWFVGAAMPQLLRRELTTFRNGVDEQSVEEMHVFVHGGYIYSLNPMIDLKPSLLIRYSSGAPLNGDINLNAYYQKRYGIGLGYRHGQSLVAMAEVQVHPLFKVAYAYDRAVGTLGTFAGSTHELLLRFDLVQKGNSISPRLY
jgi:type IX secretion system PorP/SprF family membrane protein